MSLFSQSNINVFAKQYQQVYYTYIPSFRKDRSRVDWLSVLKNKTQESCWGCSGWERRHKCARDEVFQVSELFESYRVTPSIDLEENSNFHVFCCYPIFDPCFDKFSEKIKK